MQDGSSRLTVYVAHRAALIDYAAPILGCRARAEDVVQEAYFRFVEPAASGAGQGTAVDQPVGYLYRVVRNLALDWLRSLGADQRRHEAHHMLTTQGAAAPSPEDRAVCRDALRVVDDALAALPERTAAAFRMHRLGGRTLQQIAAALGVSVATAHRLVRDGHAAVARRLEEG
ncbi:sigma-70 family RNA polymerase sigma factor [Novispirillum sp. DQ9]|uniref:sigma-70 family RNA polymerase sigma factor n=1 Tax=Novispirillum sp. DQ9 TaxID=3398612 RepID=UPI003C7C819E